jgi:hypothetical protein
MSKDSAVLRVAGRDPHERIHVRVRHHELSFGMSNGEDGARRRPNQGHEQSAAPSDDVTAVPSTAMVRRPPPAGGSHQGHVLVARLDARHLRDVHVECDRCSIAQLGFEISVSLMSALGGGSPLALPIALNTTPRRAAESGWQIPTRAPSHHCAVRYTPQGERAIQWTGPPRSAAAFAVSRHLH